MDPSLQEQYQAFRTVARSEKDTLFSCGGVVALNQPVRLHDGKHLAPHSFPTPKNDHSNLQLLLEACGNGLTLNADQFFTSFSLSETRILSEIHDSLVPTATSICATLSQLHVDVPSELAAQTIGSGQRLKSVFGFLVVCLPQPFTGGQAVISNAGFSQSYRCEQPEEPHFVHWYAYYANCEHQVGPVTSGHRITLVYTLEALAANPRKAALKEEKRTQRVIPMKPIEAPMPMPLITSHPFYIQMVGLLQHPALARDGKVTLGFGLSHYYEIDARGTMPRFLKGMDRIMKETFDALGLFYQLEPIFKMRATKTVITATRINETAIGGRKRNGNKRRWHVVIRHSHGATRLYIGTWATLYCSGLGVNYQYPSGRRDTYHRMLHTNTDRDTLWIVEPQTWEWKAVVGTADYRYVGTQAFPVAACFMVYIPSTKWQDEVEQLG